MRKYLLLLKMACLLLKIACLLTLIFHQVRKYLLQLDERKSHVKYFRANFLCLAHSPTGNLAALDFINNLKK